MIWRIHDFFTLNNESKSSERGGGTIGDSKIVESGKEGTTQGNGKPRGEKLGQVRQSRAYLSRENAKKEKGRRNVQRGKNLNHKRGDVKEESTKKTRSVITRIYGVFER